MSCPKCKSEMKPGLIAAEGVPAKQCVNCSGLWIEKGQIDRLLSDREALWELHRNGLEKSDRSGLRCPQCLAELFTGKIPKVKTEIEICPRCQGVFLDEGEFVSKQGFRIENVAAVSSESKKEANLRRALKKIPKYTGLSGNEIFCLFKKGFSPGNIVLGNSVFSLGVIGSLTSGMRMIMGGEVTQVTSLIADGRHRAIERMHEEAHKMGATGIAGVSSELIQHASGIEFLAMGSAIHKETNEMPQKTFSSSSDGGGLYAQMDCGFTPKKFVFGNVAYSIGVGRGLLGTFKSLAKGEVKEFTDIFQHTRNLALERIQADAVAQGANAITGIETSILPFMGVQEMMMVGTAAHHPALERSYSVSPITSDLTHEEMWNLVNMGFMPERLLLGVSVYSLGFVGGVLAGLRTFVRGEQTELTELIYEARESALQKITKEAELCGADEVVGIKTYVYDLGSGLIEFLAIGTAVKKVEGLTTQTETLLPQAIIRDRDTFIETRLGTNISDLISTSRSSSQRGAGTMNRTFISLGAVLVYVLFFVFRYKYAGR